MFSVDFGLLAVWWASARIQALESGQLASHLGIGAFTEQKAAQDMSMLDWALGPVKPEDNNNSIEISKQEQRQSAADKLKPLTVEGEEGAEEIVSLRHQS